MSLFSDIGKGFDDAYKAARGLVVDGYHSAVSAVDGIQQSLDHSKLNSVVSGLASVPDSILNHRTLTDMSFLNDKTAIRVPDAPLSAASSPTMAQFFNAANAGYTIAGVPDGMRAFVVNGQQLAVNDLASGMAAKVWVTDKNQVIIAYEGTTGGDNLLTNPTQVVSQIGADTVTADGKVSAAQKAALAFAHHVTNLAQQRGINTDSIYVTGHSLGGIESSYVAQQTGLGGVAFESTGIPVSSSAVGNGKNFISVSTYGDPVGTYSTDMEGGVLAYSKDGGKLPHYGHTIMIGDVNDQKALNAADAGLGQNLPGDLRALLKNSANFVGYHLPATQAQDLGIAIHPRSLTADSTPIQHGQVFPIGSDTISQAIAADKARTDYHGATVPQGGTSTLLMQPSAHSDQSGALAGAFHNAVAV